MEKFLNEECKRLPNMESTLDKNFIVKALTAFEAKLSKIPLHQEIFGSDHVQALCNKHFSTMNRIYNVVSDLLLQESVKNGSFSKEKPNDYHKSVQMPLDKLLQLFDGIPSEISSTEDLEKVVAKEGEFTACGVPLLTYCVQKSILDATVANQMKATLIGMNTEIKNELKVKDATLEEPDVMASPPDQSLGL